MLQDPLQLRPNWQSPPKNKSHIPFHLPPRSRPLSGPLRAFLRLQNPPPCPPPPPKPPTPPRIPNKQPPPHHTSHPAHNPLPRPLQLFPSPALKTALDFLPLLPRLELTLLQDIMCFVPSGS